LNKNNYIKNNLNDWIKNWIYSKAINIWKISKSYIPSL